jgi:hypothetical protein
VNYDEFSQLTRSQKITLAVIKAKQRLKKFTFVSGSTWTRVTPYYVSDVLGATFYFDPATSTLTLTSLVNPNTLEIIVEYSFFFSDFPVNQEVEYEARLIDIGALKLELDTENTGIAIESDSSIKLENTDGFFDDIFDTLIWENQECLFYSWSPSIPWSEKRLIYKGFINTKTFSEKQISFSIKDSFFKLREKTPFTGTRLIYGRAKNLDCSALDKVGTGYDLSGSLSGRSDRDLLAGVMSGLATSSTITGVGTLFSTQLIIGDKIRVIDGLVEYSYTVSGIASNVSLTISGTIATTFSGAIGKNASISNNIVTGVGTFFLDEVSPDDEITILGVKYKIDTVTSDTALVTKEQIQTAFTSQTATILPSVNYREKNRSWNVSGHLLADYVANIITVYSQRTFEVDNISHIFDGDLVRIGDDRYTVSSVSGNIVTINQAAITTVIAGQTIKKLAIQRLTFNDVEFVHGRDYQEINADDGCDVVFYDTAEFNVADENLSGVSFSFVNSSRTVTSLSNSVDLTELYRSRDWIKPYTGAVTTWYEILDVDQATITLRHAFNETRNFTGPGLFKKPDYIGDDSLILVDCMGKRSSSLDSGIWLKTASDAVSDICTTLGLTSQNSDSFEDAKADAPYCLNVVHPKNIGDDLPIARDMILEINKSVFGSLYSDSDFNIAFSVLNADRDETAELIADDDIISFSTSTKNQIAKTVNATYCIERGTEAFQSYSFNNENIPGISTELAIELALYYQADAEVISQRYALLRSQSQTTVNIKGKLSLISKSLNDRIYLNLQRLFKRYGSSGNIKIGLVNSISKDSSTVDIQVNDLGNLFSRVGSIAPNTVTDFSTASEEDISKYCFIVDNDTETPDTASDAALGSNLIG